VTPCTRGKIAYAMRLAVLALVLFAATGCKAKHCAATKTDTEGSSVRVEWSGCPDDHNHTIECEMRGRDFTCNCNPGSSFVLATKSGASGDVTAGAASEGCGWDFIP